MSATRYINAFRAKSAADDRWMYGDLIRGTHISHPMGATTIKPETVGMYAGFIDKHGARVFEHDICRYTAIRTTVVGTVVWERGCFWLCADDERKEPFYKVATIGEFEVIGNIHDNPELISGKQVTT